MKAAVVLEARFADLMSVADRFLSTWYAVLITIVIFVILGVSLPGKDVRQRGHRVSFLSALYSYISASVTGRGRAYCFTRPMRLFSGSSSWAIVWSPGTSMGCMIGLPPSDSAASGATACGRVVTPIHLCYNSSAADTLGQGGGVAPTPLGFLAASCSAAVVQKPNTLRSFPRLSRPATGGRARGGHS